MKEYFNSLTNYVSRDTRLFGKLIFRISYIFIINIETISHKFMMMVITKHFIDQFVLVFKCFHEVLWNESSRFFLYDSNKFHDHTDPNASVPTSLMQNSVMNIDPKYNKANSVMKIYILKKFTIFRHKGISELASFAQSYNYILSSYTARIFFSSVFNFQSLQ